MSAPEKPAARTPPETPAAIADVPYVPPEDRWTKRKMAEFLRVLAATQQVKGEPFDIAWEAAFQHGYDALHQAALERALHGVEEPVFHGGEQIGTRRRYDERLTVFLLARRNAQGAQRLSRYGAAAEFWSDRWETMLDLVEHGPVVWQDADGKRARPDDAKLGEELLLRHALDAGEDRRRNGKR